MCTQSLLRDTPSDAYMVGVVMLWQHAAIAMLPSIPGVACLDRNPKERPTAAELLQHAWLVDLIPRSMATPLTNISMDGPVHLKVKSAPYSLILATKI